MQNAPKKTRPQTTSQTALANETGVARNSAVQPDRAPTPKYHWAETLGAIGGV